MINAMRSKCCQPFGQATGKGLPNHETLSVILDTICERYIDDGVRVVIKLDVKGAEVSAPEGAEKLLLERRPLIIYEDHGNDLTSRVSDYILRTLGMQVYCCTDDMTLVPMQTAAAVSEVKTLPTRGYNFFACSPA